MSHVYDLSGRVKVRSGSKKNKKSDLLLSEKKGGDGDWFSENITVVDTNDTVHWDEHWTAQRQKGGKKLGINWKT